MQGKHGSFITDLIFLIKAPTNQVVEGKLNWVHSGLRCMGASNQKSFFWFKSDSGRCSSLDCSLSSAMQNVVFVRHTELEGLGINAISWLCTGSRTCIPFWHLLWKGWLILTSPGILYTLQLIILAEKAVVHFFLAWPLLGGSPCGLDLCSTPPFLLVLHPLSLSCSLSNSSLPVFFSAPGMSSSRVALWLSSLYSHHIVTTEVQGCKLKPLSAWTLWSAAPYDCLATLLSGSSETSLNQKTSTFYFFFAS